MGDSSSRQIRFGVVFSYVNIGVQVIVSLLYTPFLIRMLGQREYGLFSIAFSAIGLFSILDMGLGNANIRYTALYRASGEADKEKTLHGTLFMVYSVIGMVGFLLGMVFLANIERFFGNNMSGAEVDRLKSMFLCIIVSLSISFPLSVFGCIIRGYERFVFAKITDLLRIVLIPLLSVGLLLSGYRSVAVIAAISAMSVVLLLINAIYCLRALKIKLDFKGFELGFLKEILAFSFFVFLGTLAYNIDNSSNQFVLGIVSGSVMVSVYALAYNLVINFTTLSLSVSAVFLPAITKIPHDENRFSRYNGYFIAIGRLQFYILALFYLGFVFFGRQFISLWAGPGFEDSYYVSLILMSTLGIYLVQTAGKSILEAMNQHQFRSVMHLLMCVVNIALSFWLSSRYGAIGAAVSLALVWLLGFGVTLNIFYAKKIRLRIGDFWLQLLKIVPSFIPALAFAFLYLRFHNADTWLNLGLGAVLFALVYCLSIVLFSFNEFEKQTILEPVLRRISRKRKMLS